MNKCKKKVTTYDIARRAGVDQSSVSKVLNGATNFRDQTVSRIRKACKELDFVPNSSARALRSRRSHALAVHVPFGSETVIADPFVSELLDALRQQASKAGYDIILAHGDAPEDFATLVRSHRADGIIITSPRSNDLRLKQILDFDIPCVLGRYDGTLGPRMCIVDVDNADTGRRVKNFLRQRGCAHIGVIVQPEGVLPSDDFLKGLLQTKTGRMQCTIVRTEVDIASIRRAAEDLLTGDVPYSAVVTNTCLGMLALRRAVETSSRPDTLVLGSDSILNHRIFGPAPCIALPVERLGQRMVDTLIKIIETGETPPPELLPAAIVDPSGKRF